MHDVAPRGVNRRQEPVSIEISLIRLEDVATRARDQPTFRPKSLTEVRHVHLEGSAPGLRRLLAPKHVGYLGRRQHPVAMGQQKRKQGPLTSALEAYQSSRGFDFYRTEDSIAHGTRPSKVPATIPEIPKCSGTCTISRLPGASVLP